MFYHDNDDHRTATAAVAKVQSAEKNPCNASESSVRHDQNAVQFNEMGGQQCVSTGNDTATAPHYAR